MIFDQIIWWEPTNDQKILHQIENINGGLIDQIFDSNGVVFFLHQTTLHTIKLFIKYMIQMIWHKYLTNYLIVCRPLNTEGLKSYIILACSRTGTQLVVYKTLLGHILFLNHNHHTSSVWMPKAVRCSS